MAKKKATTKRTAKKAPAKKTTKKRAYVRRAPVKKAVTKRKYTRRKPVEVPQEAPAQKHDDGVDALPASLTGLMTGQAQDKQPDAEQEGSSKPEVKLEDINVIDLRGMPAAPRLALASMLNDLGYITTSVEDLLDAKNLLMIMETDALVMLHANKLANPAKWDDVKDDRRISRMGVSMNVEFDFSEPDSSHPNVMEVDGALYARIR